MTKIYYGAKLVAFLAVVCFQEDKVFHFVEQQIGKKVSPGRKKGERQKIALGASRSAKYSPDKYLTSAKFGMGVTSVSEIFEALKEGIKEKQTSAGINRKRF